MTHKLKTEMFSQKIEYSGGVCFWPLTPLFSFVSFHLKYHLFILTQFLTKKMCFPTQSTDLSIFTHDYVDEF